jgi:hypothetical protein
MISDTFCRTYSGSFKKFKTIRAADKDLAHVTYIENRCVLSAVKVFFDDSLWELDGKRVS